MAFNQLRNANNEMLIRRVKITKKLAKISKAGYKYAMQNTKNPTINALQSNFYGPINRESFGARLFFRKLFAQLKELFKFLVVYDNIGQKVRRYGMALP